MNAIPTPSSSSRTVVLAGPPGVGKTSVAPLAAQRLGLATMDLDDVIQRREHQTPAQIIQTKGEVSFRDSEVEALKGLRGLDAVLALGGGTLSTRSGRSAARRLGPILGLELETSALQQRLHADESNQRPLLNQGLAALLKERKVSNLSVDARVTADGSTQDVADRVVSCAEGLKHIEAEVGEARSRILVGRGLEHAPVGALAHLQPQRPVLVIVDLGVPEAERRRFLAPVQALLPTHVVEVPGGEPVKSWDFAGKVLEDALEAGCGRQSAVLGLGGGATCDLAGFVAHLLGRGAPLVLVPSTLLAQVDASVGGKCAVNMGAGRNLVGAFHPAADVVVDAGLLASQSPRDYRSGLAELLKIAIISDEALFEALIKAQSADTDMVARAITLKAAIVQRDPYERDERRILNLGHTLAHGLETASDYTLRHGEAVAIGIATVARYSAARGWTSQEQSNRVVSGLQSLGLATTADPNLLTRAVEYIGADKKSAAGEVALIGIRGVADVFVRTLPLSEARLGLVRHGGLR